MKTIFHDFNEPLFSFHRIIDGYNPGYLHFHTYYEISVVKCGRLNIITNGVNIPTDKPCVILHAPYSFHEIIAENGTSYDTHVFHFSKSCAELFPKELIDIAAIFRSQLTVIPIDTIMEQQIYPILEAYSDDPSRENLRIMILACILEITQRSLSSAITDLGTDTPAKLGYIREISNYIGEHYSERITAEQLAKMHFISRQKLDADFKNVMNVTLKQYILDTRTANAVRMLSHGSKIADVTYECGFVNESHFIRTFKKRIGKSPYKYSKSSEYEQGLAPL